MQREIRGIAGGRWFARTWVAPSTLPQNMNAMGLGMDFGAGTTGQITRPPTPPEAMYHSLFPGMSQLDSLAQVAASSSRLPSVKPEQPPEEPMPRDPQEQGDPIDVDMDAPSEPAHLPEGLSSRGPASRTSASPSPHPVPSHNPAPSNGEWPDVAMSVQ